MISVSSVSNVEGPDNLSNNYFICLYQMFIVQFSCGMIHTKYHLLHQDLGLLLEWGERMLNTF